MRVFAAILAPEQAREAIAKAAACLDGSLGARLIEPKNYHFTLKFIGEADSERARQIEEALARVKFAPFSVRLAGAGAFPSAQVPRAIWLGGESQGASELAAKVEDALSFLNLRKEKFALHLTVARSKGVADIDEFMKTGEVCGFEVRSFALMKSTLAAHGAVYEVLREFPAEGEGE
jgi:2'-5' RNA ligase